MKKDEFICIDCESTGLDPKNDRIIEIAAVYFDHKENFETMESLINPGCPIPEESIKIHNITPNMVQGKPSIKEFLPKLLSFIGNRIIVGHGILFDISLIQEEAQRHKIPCKIQENRTIDTLRMARSYGESSGNSLEKLREHFNIDYEGAHRALNDVIVNIDVFRYLAKQFKSTKDIFERLSHPILMKHIPLGKHKGRLFKEIPLAYLQWAAKMDFDQDLLFSIRTELKRRKQGNNFAEATNPFSSLS